LKGGKRIEIPISDRVSAPYFAFKGVTEVRVEKKSINIGGFFKCNRLNKLSDLVACNKYSDIIIFVKWILIM
jgi:hypothetical protein